jgi:hypothetical protein
MNEEEEHCELSATYRSWRKSSITPAMLGQPIYGLLVAFAEAGLPFLQ